VQQVGIEFCDSNVTFENTEVCALHNQKQEKSQKGKTNKAAAFIHPFIRKQDIRWSLPSYTLPKLMSSMKISLDAGQRLAPRSRINTAHFFLYFSITCHSYKRTC